VALAVCIAIKAELPLFALTQWSLRLFWSRFYLPLGLDSHHTFSAPSFSLLLVGFDLTQQPSTMAERIDMSLDQIIQRDKIFVGRRGRGGARVGTRGGSAVRGRKTNVKKIGAVGRQLKSSTRTVQRVQNFATTKTVRYHSSLRLSRSIKYECVVLLQNPRQVPDKWLHDKFVGEVKSSSLMVSNLDYGVSGMFCNVLNVIYQVPFELIRSGYSRTIF